MASHKPWGKKIRDDAAPAAKRRSRRANKDAAITKACIILPPEERRAAKILKRIMDEMIQHLDTALTEATEQARLQFGAAGLRLPTLQQAFFASLIC